MRATALILCGGRATRMGGVDKPLQPFQGRPLVAHVLERLAPQTDGRVLISANRHLDDYRRLGHPVLTDPLPDFPGPLAGVLAGLNALATRPRGGEDPGDGDWLLVASGDSPWLPADLLARLASGLAPGQSAAMALGREAPGEPLRSQPLASLVHARHRDALEAALRAGERRVERWLDTLPLARVAFDRPGDDTAFANINDRSELERLERLR
ncbi:molybdenum cofactor guanylyltransferase MobA [Mitsuaria sp. GD03876]|uniref:molybdenum cofactor guanylyltransferase MobA n=1 Tax=Mitsuaria sp. GD03876 TaxID=2975399 RepID=UPI00244C5EB5|nr:molybdenum cofactor guanylyltransferase MobA [Mitsuaria sp. GD03876]MDH0864307.1 molybdenum cofactor guanylyltransferase [Mitsuaria sp. GD03876]